MSEFKYFQDPSFFSAPEIVPTNNSITAVGTSPFITEKQPTGQFTNKSATVMEKSATKKRRNRGAGKWNVGMKELPLSFTPSKYDVICARGKEAWNHPGNGYFRAVVKASTKRYHKSTNRIERTIIVNEILSTMNEVQSRFVRKEDDGRWVEIGEPLAREKTTQMLRNNGGTARSSHQCKKQRRVGIRQNLINTMIKNRDIARSLHEVEAKLQRILEEKEGRYNISADAEAMEAFNVHNANMLNIIKSSPDLVRQFQMAESSGNGSHVQVDDNDDEAESMFSLGLMDSSE